MELVVHDQLWANHAAAAGGDASVRIRDLLSSATRVQRMVLCKSLLSLGLHEATRDASPHEINYMRHSWFAPSFPLDELCMRHLVKGDVVLGLTVQRFHNDADILDGLSDLLLVMRLTRYMIVHVRVSTAHLSTNDELVDLANPTANHWKKKRACELILEKNRAMDNVLVHYHELLDDCRDCIKNLLLWIVDNTPAAAQALY